MSLLWVNALFAQVVVNVLAMAQIVSILHRWTEKVKGKLQIIKFGGQAAKFAFVKIGYSSADDVSVIKWSYLYNC